MYVLSRDIHGGQLVLTNLAGVRKQADHAVQGGVAGVRENEMGVRKVRWGFGVCEVCSVSPAHTTLHTYTWKSLMGQHSVRLPYLICYTVHTADMY